MKNDTQHLDYLISQYVDGCLDPAGKKLVEQQLLHDPESRKLYKDHRDTQDLLDDWGNRIPMINWAEFDQKLAIKLENETVGGRAAIFFRRWARPVAAAAALLLAAGLGYLWHGAAQNLPSNNTVQLPPAQLAPLTSVTVVDAPRSDRPSHSAFQVTEDAAGKAGPPTRVASVSITAPGDSIAAESLRQNLAYGLQNVSDSARIPQAKVPVAIEVRIPAKDPATIFP